MASYFRFSFNVSTLVMRIRSDWETVKTEAIQSNPLAGEAWKRRGQARTALGKSIEIGRNITTNESVNATRYGYLQGADGRFHNPYNNGFLKNFYDSRVYK